MPAWSCRNTSRGWNWAPKVSLRFRVGVTACQALVTFPRAIREGGARFVICHGPVDALEYEVHLS
jgi:hypothetical protein